MIAFRPQDIKRCVKCAISEHFPGIRFGDSGVCVMCEKHAAQGGLGAITARTAQRIAQTIQDLRGKGPVYDAIVAFSGGKDSTYILYHLKREYDLRLLAFLIDNDFVSTQAFVNARAVTETLGVDLIIYRPDPRFMHKMYRVSLEQDLYSPDQLRRANAACLSCINLINNRVLDEAVMRRVPIIAGGYIGGQTPEGVGVIRTNSSFLSEYREKNSAFLASKIDPQFPKYLHISAPATDSSAPVIINPLLGMDYSEQMVLEAISQLGWQRPQDTGESSSNCLLNDYAIAVHFEKYGYHPYEAEVCLQVRTGAMSLSKALHRLNAIKAPADYPAVRSRLEGSA